MPLKRALGLYATTALVIGSVVGSGIFSSPSEMARDSERAVFARGMGAHRRAHALWRVYDVRAGRANAEDRRALRILPRSLWRRHRLPLWLGKFYDRGNGAIAAISFFFAMYFENFVPLPHFTHALAAIGVTEATPWNIPFLGAIFPYQFLGRKLVASFLVIFLTALNIRGVRLGGTLQSISTTTKMLAILAIVLVAFIAGSHVGSISHITSSALPLVKKEGASIAQMRRVSGWTLIGANCTRDVRRVLVL